MPDIVMLDEPVAGLFHNQRTECHEPSTRSTGINAGVSIEKPAVKLPTIQPPVTNTDLDRPTPWTL
jgi:hypothetical protein